MIPMGMSSATSVRVSNSLGANLPHAGAPQQAGVGPHPSTPGAPSTQPPLPANPPLLPPPPAAKRSAHVATAITIANQATGTGTGAAWGVGCGVDCHNPTPHTPHTPPPLRRC